MHCEEQETEKNRTEKTSFFVVSRLAHYIINRIQPHLFLPLLGVWHGIFNLWFFNESVSSGLLSIPLGHFKIFYGRYLQLRVNITCNKLLAGVTSGVVDNGDYALSWILIDFMTQANSGD